MHVLDYSSPRLVVAMDQARNNGVITGLEDPGLIFGRNIWQSDNPVGMVKALRHVMAGGPVEEAERIVAER